MNRRYCKSKDLIDNNVHLNEISYFIVARLEYCICTVHCTMYNAAKENHLIIHSKLFT